MPISTIAGSLLRVVIVAVAALALWYFSNFYGKAIVTLTGGQAQWLFSRSEAFLAGVAALLLYVSPILPFAIGVMIHGI